ncbi:hypothetical protein [Hymenobacter sp. GOD-10R]|uniref:hypothetical protein n=1 Tax=Hymenobacter sp. GOD-10R TaxID=3093922 RepID=UPI002D774231|nr:hypothetical protein [Hymenobacter sp. GOD-10R]WRQ26608.1 hypothetical protein SD425_16165 [Hymenobacter sp. GOD-10R]
MKTTFQYRNGRFNYRQKRHLTTQASPVAPPTTELAFPAPSRQTRELGASSKQFAWDKAA